jgi:rSAM/selenodomain-associated transferase 2
MGNSRAHLSLAVVLPTLNEESNIGAVLCSVLDQSEKADRIVVADGHSTDATQAVAQGLGVDVVLAPQRGRGCQTAYAVQSLREDIVLVLHADTLLPAGALSSIRRALVAYPQCPGGALGHVFDSPKWLYRLIEWWDRRRARRGTSYGDQVQFFRRASLETQGGYPDQPIMEDIELSKRLQRLGRPVYLNHPVLTSPRRFQRLGIVRTLFENFRLRRAYESLGLRACQSIVQRYY